MKNIFKHSLAFIFLASLIVLPVQAITQDGKGPLILPDDLGISKKQPSLLTTDIVEID